MVIQTMETKPKISNFIVGEQAPPPDQLEVSRFQIIAGAGSTALLGISEYEGDLPVESSIELVESEDQKDVRLKIVNAVTKRLRVHPRRHGQVPIMDPRPEAEDIFITGYYEGAKTVLAATPEPLDDKEVERVLTAA